MSIRNIDSFVKNLWDWKILDGCFGKSRISPTDIDGLVERRGKFLMLEGKSLGKDVPTGQQIMFNNLVKTGVFTIIIVWGDPNAPETIQVWGKEKVVADISIFRKEVEKWYNSVDS